MMSALCALLFLQAYADAMARAAASNGSSNATGAAAAPGSAAAAATAAATAAPASAAPASATGGAAAAAAVASGLPVPLLAVPAVTVITPIELARDLFQWVHDEEVVDALYLQVSASSFTLAGFSSSSSTSCRLTSWMCMLWD
jgi:hypothetical protein